MSNQKKDKLIKEDGVIESMGMTDSTETPLIIEDMNAQSFSWNVGIVEEMLDNGTMDLDILVQRGSVWNHKKDSLLIPSLLTRTPIQNCSMNKVDGVYGVIDGKQRLTAIYRFVKGKYKLHSSTPPIKVNGQIFKLAGYDFKSLPETLQNRIKNYSIRGDWFDNLSSEKEIEYFILVNSGKPVNAAEISRSRIKSKKVFVELSSHPAMLVAINESNRMKHKHIDILSQLWCLCFGNVLSLLQKDIGPILATNEVSEEQKDKLIQTFDYLVEYYKNIMSEDKKRLPKMQKPTHILSLGYMAFLAIQMGIICEEFVSKAKSLFDGEARAVTRNNRYNYAVGAGSSKPEQVRIRIEEIKKALE